MPNPVLSGVIHISLSSHHKLRLSKSKQCVHSHSASKNQDLNLGPLDSTIVTALLYCLVIIIMLLAILIIGSL